MTEKEIAEALNNFQLERVNYHEISGKIISQWKLKTSLSEMEIDLGDANAYIKTNHKKYLTEDKEEVLQSVESSLKEYFLRNAEKLEKLIKKALKR